MLIDHENQFGAAQAVTATGSTASTNVIDLGVAREIGGAASRNIALLVQVVTAFASSGSATLQVQFQTSSDNSAWKTLVQSDAVPVAQLAAGYRFLANDVPGATQRYVRLNYVVGTAAMTAGTITAAIVPALDAQASYPGGYAA